MAEIDLQPKKRSPWPWIIGLIVLALVIWALTRFVDREPADQEPVGLVTDANVSAAA